MEDLNGARYNPLHHTWTKRAKHQQEAGETLYGPIVGYGGGGPGYSTVALCFPDVDSHCVTAVALASGDQPDLGLSIAFKLGVAADALCGPMS